MNMLTVDIKTLSDSEVYTEGEGYERIAIFTGWHQEDPRLMARTYIRVDRNPAASFAKIGVWTTQAGWQDLIQIPPNDFWHDMPGYLRWARDTSDRATYALTQELVQRLVTLQADSDI